MVCSLQSHVQMCAKFLKSISLSKMAIIIIVIEYALI